MRSFVGLLLLVIAGQCVSAPPRVVSVSPSPQSLNADRTSPILVTFDVAVDSATITPANVAVFARWSGVLTGILTLENNGTRLRFTPTKYPSVGDWVTVTLSKNIRSRTGEAMQQGFSWQYWVQTQRGTMLLTELRRVPVRRQGEPHIQTYGAHGADLNNDGYSDFFVPNEISADCRVFLNDSTGSYAAFTVHPIPHGSRPSTNESADFNRDGNIDIAVGNSTGDSVTVFLGDGNGGFLSIRNFRASGGIRGLTVADVDGDGDADIITANRSGNNIAVLANNGDGTFAQPTLLEANGNGETACAAADANGDGVLDLFVGAYASSEIILMLGNGTGSFTYATKVAAGGNGPWMIAVGDMNGDGNVDVVSANSASNTCSVIFGNGTGGLLGAVTYPTGAFPLAIDVGDIDGDGDLDLVTSNYSGRSWSVYENIGAGVLGNRRTLPSSRAGSCATLHDRDNDGDLDMTGIDEEDDLIFLFENRLPSAVLDASTQPVGFVLYPNVPNPFSVREGAAREISGTVIRYDLPNTSDVQLTIVDLAGRRVRTLVSATQPAGSAYAEWNGTDEHGHTMASGIYVCRLLARSKHGVMYSTARRMILLR